MLVMVVFAIAGISPAAAQTVYVERYETYPAAVAPGLAYVPQDRNNSAFLSEPWLVWAAASHAVMQRQTLSAVLN